MRPRGSLVSLVLVAACAGGSPARRPEALVLADAGKFVRETPPSFTPPALPTNGVVVIVEPAHTWRLVMFAEEQRAVSRSVAGFLRAEHPDWHVVEPELVDGFTRAAANHWSPGASFRCQRPATAHQLLDQIYPHAYRAQVNATCDEGCTLHVTVIRYGDEGSEKLGEWETAIAGELNPDLWASAADALAPYQPEGGMGGVLGMLGAGDRDRPRVEIRDVHAEGAWHAKPTAASFAAVQATLDGCWEPGWTSGSSDSFHLAVDGGGAVSRCEPTGVLYDTPSPRHACLCRAMSGARFPRASAERRVEVQLMNQLDTVRTADDAWLQHVSFMEGERVPGRLGEGVQAAEHAVARCFADAGGVRGTLVAHFTVAGDGTTSAAWIEDARGIPAGAETCVKQALQAARFPCTPDGRTTTFAVGLRAYLSEAGRNAFGL